MKQHITTKQLEELSGFGKGKLNKWWKPKEYDFVAWHDGYHKEDGLNWSIEIVGKPDLVTLRGRNKMYPLLSIGQMIEFLDEKEHRKVWDLQKKNTITDNFWTVETNENIYEDDELCDALWEAVKEILEAGGEKT